MEKQTRLTRSQVIARLRQHAAAHGFVSTTTLDAHDKLVLRSLPLYFAGLSAARHVAGVPGPPYRKPNRKTGPKPGTKQSTPRRRTWSRERVIDELRRLHRAGKSTAWRDLMMAGRATLIRSAFVHVGGLQQARKAARVPAPKRRGVAKNTWSTERVVAAIRARSRAKESLAMTRVPPPLYTAARWHFGTWRAALAAAGIDPRSARLPQQKYTKDVIIARLREAARAGSDLRSKSLARTVDLKAVGREFGTLGEAIRAAGLVEHLQQRRHGGAKWTRELLIETLRARAAAGVYTFTPGLRRAVQVYFGGAGAARAAAGTPDPVDVRIAQRRDARHGRDARKRGSTQRIAWSRARVIAELRAGTARGDHAMTPALYRAARVYFGGAREARAAAGVSDPIDLRAEQRRRAKAAFAARDRERRGRRHPTR